ncbi:MAG: ATP-binding cassette domain-containing protein [Ignavibacteriae bacterium]|nr:ATP-binding cassette domain-containing protein [Ignavibacteriota bacterium]
MRAASSEVGPTPEPSPQTQTGKPQNVIEIQHVKKAFGTHEVLKDISLAVAKGETLAVLGRSGVGKSVLIKCIVALLEPDSGTIMLFGKDTTTVDKKELAAMRHRIGFLFQAGALYDSMSVRDNLAFPLRSLEVKPTAEEQAELIKTALDDVGLGEAIEKMPSELSGGMRKRVGLARTLIQKPEIMLYDEPTTGLDPITAREISRLLLEVQERYKTSSIIITHDIECANIAADRIVLLNDGYCVAGGTYDELERSEDEWVRSFFAWHADRSVTGGAVQTKGKQ